MMSKYKLRNQVNILDGKVEELVTMNVKPMKKLRIVVIQGMSGSGKDTVKNQLVRLADYKEFEIFTTRPRRTNNETGYHFITRDEFMKEKSNNKVLEFRSYSIDTDTTWIYGTYYPDLDSINEDDKYVVISTPEGTSKIKEWAESITDIEITIIPIFLDVPYYERLSRIFIRKEDEAYSNVLEREERELEVIDAFPESLIHKVKVTKEMTEKDVFYEVLQLIAVNS